ncbi:MAG: septal ring lytic transglycosylase RlpA family protein [Verrucomicrobia bacterium]|nr:septal ring lytic transglycosylase RlpA family protein [Verrucomicrobiota bacterium]
MKIRVFDIALCFLISGLLVACSTSRATGDSQRRGGSVVSSQNGKASWYSARTNGTRTASGEPLSDKAFTAAHRTLPFGTQVRVTNTVNGKNVIVRITDRGPFGKHRIIDLGHAAAKRLDMIKAGVVPVRVEVLK